MNTITKRDLMRHGYTEYEARAILRAVKRLLVESGHTYYANKKVARVPKERVEDYLQIQLSND
ncbi:DUF3173 domain-containing protein [Pseudolactococcus yaeyamensis]